MATYVSYAPASIYVTPANTTTFTVTNIFPKSTDRSKPLSGYMYQKLSTTP